MARRREKPGMVRGVAWARGVGGAESKCAAGVRDAYPIVFYILFSKRRPVNRVYPADIFSRLNPIGIPTKTRETRVERPLETCRTTSSGDFLLLRPILPRLSPRSFRSPRAGEGGRVLSNRADLAGARLPKLPRAGVSDPRASSRHGGAGRGRRARARAPAHGRRPGPRPRRGAAARALGRGERKLRVCRTANADATRDANAAGGDADASAVSQGAAYVVQWCARRREAPSGPPPRPSRRPRAEIAARARANPNDDRSRRTTRRRRLPLPPLSRLLASSEENPRSVPHPGRLERAPPPSPLTANPNPSLTVRLSPFTRRGCVSGARARLARVDDARARGARRAARAASDVDAFDPSAAAAASVAAAAHFARATSRSRSPKPPTKPKPERRL